MNQAKFEPLQGFESIDSQAMSARALSFFEMMKRRRTVREFADTAVPKDVIENAIRTAGRAPSGANK